MNYLIFSINRSINPVVIVKIAVCGVVFLSNVARCDKPDYMNKSFHDAMSYRPKYINGGDYVCSEAEKSPSLVLAKKTYDQRILKNFEYSVEPRIPKVIHQIWLSGPVPEKYNALRKSFLDKHPDWQYKIWSAKDIEEFGLINKDKYDNARAIGTKADITRYEILYRLGGVHIDLDVECIKPFDLLHHCCDFYSCVEPEFHFFVSNAIMGARPGHPIFRRCVENLAKCDPAAFKFWDIVFNTSVGFFTKCILEVERELIDRTVIFPATYFCPVLSFEAKMPRVQLQNLLAPETFAIHYWFGSWVDSQTLSK